MILLDTNVISEALKPQPHPSVRDWLDAQAAETLHMSSVTIAEVLFGIGALPAGKRKQGLTTAFENALALFKGRILSFDATAARRYADVAVEARASGKGFPTPLRIHRGDRCRARLRRRVGRHERLHGRWYRGNRPVELGCNITELTAGTDVRGRSPRWAYQRGRNTRPRNPERAVTVGQKFCRTLQDFCLQRVSEIV